LNAVIGIIPIHADFTVLIISFQRDVSHEGTVVVERLVSTIARGTIWLDSRKQLFEKLETVVYVSSAVAPKINYQLLLTLLHCVCKELTKKLLCVHKP
jgi:hypothetical protein